jgi:fused signal recognition particle receptor
MRKFFGKLKESLGGAKLKESLDRTRKNLADNVHKVLTGRPRIDEETWEELEEALIAGDVGVGAAETLVERLRERVKAEGLAEGAVLEEVLAEEVAVILRKGEAPPPAAEAGSGMDAASTGVAKPHVILLVGVNGTGKTTTLGKLAHHYRGQGRSVLVAAADTFRAAAVEQLRIWADRAGVELIANQSGADPAAVAYDAVGAAQARGVDVVLVDTAGRLQTKVNLMEELRKIGRVVGKRIPGAPHEVLLVLDATTGQNAIQQAKQFGQVMEITGLVLTKVDGTAKGGVVVAIADQLGIPVRFLGLGEGMEDLAPFDAEAFAAALFERE